MSYSNYSEVSILVNKIIPNLTTESALKNCSQTNMGIENEHLGRIVDHSMFLDKLIFVFLATLLLNFVHLYRRYFKKKYSDAWANMSWAAFQLYIMLLETPALALIWFRKLKFHKIFIV